MKKECIYSLLTLFLCGCAAAPWQSDTLPSTPSGDEIVINQNAERIFETREQILNESMQTKVSAPSVSQEKIENPAQELLWPSETGIATYYAHDMEGRTTASGEPYDSEQLTAAHRTIPIGSSVRVTNLKTKQQAIVRINDRWGGGGDRIINLSKQASVQLGFGSAGTVPVQLDVEFLPSGSHVAQPSVRIQPLPSRLEESSAKNQSRLDICKNEADILGLTENFYRNHVTACLSRRE
ncbi:rare lipoprotein A [Nitrosomonas sp. Nm84]|uniref:septal ring lytic transglycosylase RlpA family protein n=1 Tax=Nitrosomonas sp. Nm84 TaxID=200124 RepID=UPI000D757AF3|nr:septal ring lytic transglycosylase RlpA family protein [Nitrosomonas sp. Nm84]PXW91380.1 rare lipoprotein A [Nitrosomonas sp. Nm84]